MINLHQSIYGNKTTSGTEEQSATAIYFERHRPPHRAAKIIALLLTLLTGIGNDVFATVWRTNSNANIDAVGSWRDVATGTLTPSNFTTVGDTWTIQNTMTQGALWTVTGDVILSSGSWAAGANAINFGGNFTNNVSAAAFTSTGITTFNGTSAQTISGTAATTFSSLTINNASGVSLSGVGCTISGNLTLTAGTFSDGGNVVILQGNIAGTGTHSSGTGGKISMTGVAKSISAATLGNLDFNAGSASAFTLTGSPTINGNLSFTGASNTLTIGAFTLTLKGTVSGMSATQYLTGSATSNLTINSTSNLGTLYFNQTTPGTTNNVATFTVNTSGFSATLGNACSVGTTLALTAGTLNDGGNVITCAGNITGTGTHISSVGGKISMTGTFKSIANGAVTLGNLELNHVGATNFSMTGSPTITGALTFTGAGNTLVIGANTLTLNGTVSGMTAAKYITGGATSNITIGATGALGTLFFDQTTVGTSNKIATFIVNGGGSATIGNSLVCQTALTLTSGKFSIGAGATLTMNGTFTGSTSNCITGGATSNLTTGGSNTYYFDQTTPGTTNNISTFIASAGTSTLGNNLSVGTTLTLTGTLADGGNVITCAGNITGAGTHSGSGKISMTGVAKSISGANFGNLEFNSASASAFTLTGSPTINGALTFTGANNTLTIGAFTLTLKGTVAGMSSTQYFTGSATSNLTINSTSNLGTIFFNQTTPGTTNNIATFTMNSSGYSATLGNACSVGTTLALTAGTLADGGNVITCAGNITGAGTHASSAGGKISMTGAAKSISNAAATLGNLELNHATATAFTMAGSPTITGALTFTGTANTLTIGAFTLTLNGTVSGMSATKYLTGSATSNLTIGSTGALGTLYFGAGLGADIKTFLVNGGGSATLGNSMTSVTLMDLTQLSGGKLAIGAGATLTISGTFTGNTSDCITGGATSNLTTGGSNTYYFDQTTPGTSNNIATFIASAGTSTLGSNLSVGTTLTLTGTLADGGFVISCAGNITGAGTHTSSTGGKISMTGVAKSISGATFGNLDFNAASASAFTLTGSPTVNGNMSFTGANNTLSIGAFTLTLKGTVSGMSATQYLTGSANSNLTINSTSNLGTLFFDQTTPGTTNNISTFTMNSTGFSATLGSNCSVSNILSLTAGTLNDGGFVINNSGNIGGAGTHVSGVGGKITMTGAAKSLSNAAATLGNVELNNVGATGFVLAGSPTITGALTFTGAANTLTLGAFTLTLNGTVSGMSATQYFTGSATSNLTIGATGALGTIFFSQVTPGTTNEVATFLMNGGGSATMGNSMVVKTALTLTSGKLAVGAGNTLTVNGTFSGSSANYLTGSATSNLITGTSSTYYFDQTTPGTSNNFALFTASAGTTTLGNNASVGTTLTLTGTLADGGNVLTCAGNVAGAGIHTSSPGGKISMTGVAKSISGATFGNLDFNAASASAFTMTGSPTINGNMSFTGANNTLTIGAFTLTLKGTVSGMSATQYLTGNGASSNLTINSTSNLGTLFFNPTTPGTTDNIATFTMNSTGFSATLGNNCSVLTTLALTAGTLNDGGHVITNTGNITGAGTHTSGAGGKISMTGAAKSISNAAATLGNLELNHAGATAYTMTGSPTITGALTFTAAANTLTLGANTLTLNGTVSGMSATKYITGSAASNITIGATGALGTIFLNQTTPGTTNEIATFLMNGGGSATLGNNMVSQTALTLTSGKLAVGAGNTLTVNGTFTGSSANYLTGSATSNLITGTSSTYYFDQTTAGTSNNFALFTASAGTTTLGNNLSVSTTLTLTGTLADNGNVITCSGNIAGAGTHTSTGSGKITMTGVAKSISGATLGNLDFNSASASAFTLTGSPMVNGNLSFTGANNTWTIGANTLTLKGTVSGMSTTQYLTGNGASSNLTINSTSDLGTLFFNPTTPGTTDNIATFTMNSTGHSATLGNNCSVLTTLALTAGTLNDGGHVITNTGNITGAGTHVSGVGGKISMTGAAKSISNAAATLGNLELNHVGATAFTMAGSPTITGALTITAAANTLTLGANTLTLSGTVSGMSATKYLTGSASSNLTIDATGALGTLFFNPTTPGTTNKIVTFTINGGGSATLGNPITVATTLALTSGTLADGANLVTCAGNITGTGTESGTGGITMTTSGATISGATIQKLTLNNAGGFGLTGSPTITGTLTLTSGKLTLGSNNIILGNAATAVGGVLSSSNMIVASGSGQVIKNYSANGSYVFPIGDASNYTPVILNVTGSYSGASMGVNVNPTKPAQNANTTNYINRYWTVTPTGISSLSYTAVATYVVGDIQAGSTESNIAMGEYPGALPWIKYGTESGHVLTSGSVTATVPTIFSGINNVAGPFPIVSSNTTICNGGNTSLSATGTTGDATLTYSWSPAAGLSATVGTPVTASPTVTTTYTLTVTDGNGEIATATTMVSVNPVPSSTGATNSSPICAGATVTLHDNSSNATAWSWTGPGSYSSTLQSPVITPAVSGVYSMMVSSTGNGCNPATVYTTAVTVSPVPSSTGATNTSPICVGGSVTLQDNSSNATVWSWTGPGGYTSSLQSPTLSPTVTGVYSLVLSSTGAGCNPGTVYTTTVTVNNVPTSTGATNNGPICVGGTVTFNDHSSYATAWSWTGPGGFTSSLQMPTATPTVSGVYSLMISSSGSGCNPATIYATSVTVNPVPSSTGATNTSPICVGGTATLNDNSSNATVWSWAGPSGYSSTLQNPAITPTVTGVYSLVVSSTGIGCNPATVYTTSVTVNPVPTSTGATNTSPICVGGTATLNDNSSNATAWSWTGPGGYSSAVQSPAITPTVSGVYSLVVSSTGSGCHPATIYTTSVTVNAVPTSTGATNTSPVCSGSTVTLIDNSSHATMWSWTGPGGYTSSLQSPVISPTVTGVYSLVVSSNGSGCNPGTVYTTTVTVNTGLPPITGNPNVCQGLTSALTDASAGGTWASITPSVATVGTNGVVTGVSAGTSVISYTISTCGAAIVVTVVPLPSPISGTTNVCVGSTTNLTDADGAGVWATTNALIATVGSSTGVVTGVGDGITTVTYTAGTGCSAKATILSSPVAAPITGVMSVCIGRNTLLSDITLGGNWTSNNMPVAQISLYTGLVTGLSAGTAVITYSLETGCTQTTVVTVDATAGPITGTNEVCNGFTTALTDATGGGTWTSSDVTVATIGSTTGLLTSVAAGTTTITYSLSTGCLSSRTVTIDALPAIVNVSASGNYCVNTTTTADNGGDGTIYYQGTTSGGTSTATPSTSQLITTSGTYYFRALSATGCWGPEGSAVITINPLPSSITGTASVCMGLTTNLTDADAGGTWASSNTSKATVGSSSGIVTGVNAGTATITYTATTGCAAFQVVTIAPVAAITGSSTVCVGSITTLGNTVTGGTWSSSNTSNATIGSASGVLSGVLSGNSNITYTTGAGCTSGTTITVNSIPSGITGTGTVCAGLTTNLTDATGSGTWSSSNTSNATVGSVTGTVTGVAAGTATITYLVSTGCKTTMVVTVNALPGAINGTASVCVNLTTSLSDATGGGTWSSSDGTLATVGTTGIITGVAAGNPIITYTLGTGCIRTLPVTVNPLSAVTGSSPVCVASTVTLADATSGGTWSSSNSAVGTVGAGTGIVTGIGSGTATITYLLPTGCKSTSIITVNAIPGIINGTASVCVGLTTSLSDATAGGTWSSSDGTLATVGTSGTVTGVAAGNPLITYTLGTGCFRTANVTVNALAAITGSTPVCVGQTITLNDAATGGVWTSGTTSVATIIGSTGVVTGVTAGTSNITYTLSTGCKANAVVTVNSLPAAITGTGNVCVGFTLALTDATAGGTWSSSDGTLATVGTNGIVTGTGAGIPSITYMLGTGCISTTPVTVYPVPTAITGTMIVCAGSTTSLSDASAGGTWSSSTPAAGTVNASGIVTGVAGGTTTITYTMGAGCYSTAVVTVNTILPITGLMSACVGSTTTLADATGGGTWSSSNGSVATIGTSGIVNGVAAGTVTISYTIASGCVRTTTVAVNNTPSAILGNLLACVGYTTSLSDAVPGGTWSSSNIFAATVGSATGIVTGQGSGTSTISYISGFGCYVTKVVTVNSLPSGIGGPSSVCPGSVITLADFAAGGTWSSSNGNATIDGSGNLTGVTTGTSTISYTITSTGCFVTYAMTIKAAPAAISGTETVCVGLVTFLSDVTSGGISWSSSNTSVATVSGGGGVTGIASGTANITYTISDNCTAVAVVTVNPVPVAITNNTPVCVGLSVTLSDGSAGGTWISGNTGIATIGSTTGSATGVAGGTVAISYQFGTGCQVTATVTVNGINAITGNVPACIGTNLVLTDASTGGTWSSSNTGVATVGSTGIVSGVGTGGTATISYTIPSGCIATTVVTINQTPSAITGTKTVCVGFTTALTDAMPGGTWSSNAGFIATAGSTGVVIGELAGTAVISYATGAGCLATTVVTVNPQPSGIGGASAVCFGSTITISDFTAGGTWSSSNSNISVDGSGHVIGLVVGASTATYTLPTGCYVTYSEQVNPLPTAVNGTLVVCAGSQTFLTDATTPGLSWTSSNTGVATAINSGAITGVAGGTSVLTYTIPTGCYTTAILTVNPLPAAATGNAPVCLGNTITLSDATAGGTWSTTDNTIATIGSTTGVVTTVAAGSVAMLYTIGTGCFISAIVNVNPIYPITGNGPACLGQTLPLSDAASGGTWSAVNGSVATINSVFGTVTPVSSGTTTVSYVLSTGCFATAVVTVTAAIANVTGGGETCAGIFTTMPLSDATAGGSWSSGDATIATVGSTGIVTGVGSGTVNITYSIGAGCVATTLVTIDEAPSSILGTNIVCAGLTSALSDDYPDGVWTTSNGTIADVGDYTGVVTGIAGGTANITYTLDDGCYNLVTVSVNPLVSLISGATSVCAGSSELLTDATSGGTWSSSNNTVATVGTDGTVTGVVGGTATVTYTAPTGCMSAFLIVVDPYAGVISGSNNVDLSATITLTDAIGGGIWSASNGNATVDGSGDVVGVSAGTVVISYTVNNVCGSATTTTTVTVNAGPAPVIVSGGGTFCGSTTITADNGGDGTIYFQGTTSGGTSMADPSTSQLITVSGTYYFRAFAGGLWGNEGSATVVINPVAGAITGAGTVCIGQTTSLTDAGGGTWNSSDNTIATVGSATGIVSGVAVGTATITYTLPTGCSTTDIVTVDPLPAAITGAAVACVGLTTNLTDATAGGTWSSNDGTIATVGTTGIVTGVAAGTTTITYTLPTGCFSTATVTIFGLPGAISGRANICLGLVTNLTDATGGGAWSSSDATTASVNSLGQVTGISLGTATITYALGTGCITTLTVTVNSIPPAITGTAAVCIGSATSLTDASAGGSWTSGATGTATVGSSTGVVTGIAAGIAGITYTMPSGCKTAASVTVNALPATVTASGGGTFCGSTTITGANGGSGTIYFQGTTSGGTSTATPGGSQVVSSSGTYYFRALSAAGCWGAEGSVSVTINPLPAAITGTASVCVGSTTNLTDVTPGGTWSSSDGTIASVATTGVVSGVANGNATITYMLGTGCYVTDAVVVNPLPAAITGSTSVCVGATTALGNTSVGGTWSSGATGVATIGSATGIASGISGGVAGITYTLATGCIATTNLNVNALPATVIASGGGTYCGSTTVTAANGGDGTIYFEGTTSGGTSTATASTSQLITTSGTYYFRAQSASGCWGIEGSVSVTINPLPAAISGATTLCVGSGYTMSDATNGGTWSSSNTSAVTIGSADGSVAALATGTSNITYMLGTGCYARTTVTVNPLPAGITGIGSVCLGLTTALTDATAGGAWSSGNAFVASVGTTGIVTGNVSGNAVITYTLGTGCITTTTVTVNPNPSAIIGATTMCLGTGYTLSDGVAGGNWNSSDGSVATIDGGGNVTTMATGTSSITYTLPTGCLTSMVITVNPLPGAINGASSICMGATTTLTDATGSGTWASGDVSIATVNVSSGLVSGVAAGNTNITYTLGTGCYVTAGLTVNQSPAAITGTATVCQGSTTALTNTVAGGAWGSSDGTVATVGTSGIVTGVAGGTATISYTLGSCVSTAVVTVNPISAITDNAPVCVASTITLSDAASGGAWSSGSISIASIGTDGVVTGLNAGTSSITYLMPTGCSTTTVVTVNPLPQNITGSNTVCGGQTITLADFTTGGLWSSNDITIATAGSTTGVITGVAGGNTLISYILPTGCYLTKSVTVYPLSAITGSTPVCVGLAVALTDATAGGTWSTSSAPIATVGTGGVVTGVAAGTAVISYVLATGCTATAVVTVNALPSAITGNLITCVGLTTALTDAGGGTWLSGATGTATVGSTGIVTGVAAGNAGITYTLPTGCIATTVVTINSVPTTINGTLTLCAGSTTALTDAVTGGTWGSSNSSVATVGVTSGIVTGVAGGTATITYTMAAGCFTTTIVTINPILPITGTLSACLGSTTTLADGTSGGTWSSSDPTTASIGSSSGIVTGNVLGTAIISYTIPSGCVRTATVAVNALPAAINGAAVVCVGATTTLTDATSGGTWSTGNAGVATAVSGTGVITGVSAGNVNITYTAGLGCFVTAPLTVNPAPSSIGGASAVCVGSSITLSDFASGGTWTSSNSNATVGSSTGIVIGVTAGTSTITYTLTSTGCFKTYNITINPVPTPVLGASTVCVGSVGFVSDATSGGVSWTSSTTTVATITNSGAITGIAPGTTTVTYTISTGCIATAVVTVNSSTPGITGNAPVCAGSTITLTDAQSGGTWVSSNTSIATVGSATGIVAGVAGGTSTVNYLLNGGCSTSVIVTVNPILSITGSTSACVGSTTTLADGTSGGTWSSGNTGIATVGSSSGIVTGVASGAAAITYTVPSGCVRSVTVNISPMTLITGSGSVCVGSTTALTDATGGGTWSSNAPFTASVGTTGIVTGNAAGTASITYAVSGCIEIQVVTVNALPSGIGGASSVCTGASITLSDFVSGGTWSSSNGNVSVGSATGVITGVTAGTSTITYMITATGCFRTYAMTINQSPNAVSGASSVCVGSVAFVSNATSVGVSWTSSTTSVATITNSGAITGVSAGTTTITYTISTGCIATEVLTVNATPSAGSISGTMTVVFGSHVTLTDGVAGGVWTSSNTVVATIGSSSGTATGVNPGTTTITYTVTNATGCYAFTTAVFSVTASAPPPHAGTVTLCVGSTATIDQSSPGGVWSSTDYNIATVNDGIVTGMSAGNAVIKYTIAGGFGTNIIYTPVEVDALPGGVVIAADPGTNIGVGEALSLTAIVDNGGPSPAYQWLVNNVPVAGATSATFVSSAFADNDSVTCEVISSGPCSGYVVDNTIVVKVNPLGVNNNITLGSDIRLLPNPSNGEFTVKGMLAVGSEYAVIEVTDILGQVIYTKKVLATDGSINEKISLSGTLANGMYMLNLHSGSENKTFHFMIEK